MSVPNYTHYLNDLNKDYLEQLANLAYKEDVFNGDHTTLATVPENAQGTASIYAKADGIVAGIEVAADFIAYFSDVLTIEAFKKDGDQVEEGDKVLTINGAVQSILTVERSLLNLMQHLSGIATKSYHFNQILRNYSTKLLDTRKTITGLRVLEKWAVALGGAVNHRLGLYDMVMLKDNHIDYAGGIQPAIDEVKKYLADNEFQIPVVVEARSMEEVNVILRNEGIYRILLDNMSLDTMTKAVGLIDGKTQTEASGGVTASNLRAIASTGVDYISTSQLNREIKPLDLTLKLN